MDEGFEYDFLECFIIETTSRWFQRFFCFHPENWGRCSPILTERIFLQMGGEKTTSYRNAYFFKKEISGFNILCITYDNGAFCRVGLPCFIGTTLDIMSL